MQSLKRLLADVRACKLCTDHLPLGVRPILQLLPSATLLVAGQAPGRKAHESGVPFDDASGDRLRQWLGMSRDVFYDASRVAILPMGFCYPGTGKSGDNPPRPECAPAWRSNLLQHLTKIRLTLVIGQYALRYHLPGYSENTLTDAVRDWRNHWPEVLSLPHPSPRNNLWLKRNPWFEKEVLPELRVKVGEIVR